MEPRNCKNCAQEFTIDSSDFAFYEKIGVPPPTWCPECRNIRRMAWREYHTLYRGTCGLCNKEIITVHAPGSPFTIYCRECYLSDAWDPTAFGREYDFSRPFFAQYRELMEAVPRPALTGRNLVNSEYTHGCLGAKNCYNVFWSYYAEDSENCYGLLLTRNAYDSYVADNSELVYEALHSNRLYRVRFGYFSDECLDVSFVYNCVGCSDSFGCINVRKQKYCLFNKQLTREEYEEQIKYWDLGSYAKLMEAKQTFRELYLATPHRYAHILNSYDSTGDVIRDAKNCKTCFSALDGVENCKYLYFGGLNLKDSMDVSAGGDTSELLYETYGVTSNASRCFFSVGGGNCQNIWYSDWATNCTNIFGCISLRNKQFCILNRQYSKQEYEQLTAQIKDQMLQLPYTDARGRTYGFGEFFPTELSAYAYNESFAYNFYPKTKEDVVQEGWRWQEPAVRSYQITKQPHDLPDHIQDIDDSICNEIIGCEHEGTCNHECTTAFRITPKELVFHKEMNVALSRLCPNCREAERFLWKKGYHLWKRQCMKPGCENEFETAFNPAGAEIVYCDRCYKETFI